MRKLCYVDGTPIWATLAERSNVNLDLWNLFIGTRLDLSNENNFFGFNSIKKINFSKNFLNLDLWNLFIAIVSLVFTYQVRIMTLSLTMLKKSTFQKKSHLNALGSKFDLDRPNTPNATYQVARSSAFWFWRRFLKGFYHIWAWRPSWSCDQDHLNKLSFPRPKESPYEIWV